MNWRPRRSWQRCDPFWRCLKYGCQRCDRDREREAKAQRLREFLREMTLPQVPDDPRLN